MFKVGDKVVRKEKDIKGFWTTCGHSSKPETVSIVIPSGGWNSEEVILFEGDVNQWYSKYFDLYVETAKEPEAPTPKFKVGDRVQTTNGVSGAIVEEVKTITEFRYKISGNAEPVRESKLSISKLPRRIWVDGVAYTEVL